MRIDFICPTCTPFTDRDLEGRGIGGNEATIVLWSRELSNRGHDVHVYVGGIPRSVSGLVHWSPLSDWDGNHVGDVVVAVRSAECLLMRLNYSIRVLYLGDRVTPGVEKLTSDDVDFVWCISRFQQAGYRQLIAPSIRTVIGSCGYDSALFFEKVRAPRDEIIFVHSGIPYRGLKRVLQLWPQLRREIPNACLHITGGYQLWGYSEMEAGRLLKRDLGEVTLSDDLVYHGILPKHQLADLLRNSDIYLYPTDYQEMCCIAVLEAMACGVIPILSNQGALPERVQHGRSGMLLGGEHSKDDDLGFVAASVRLALNERRRSEMSSEAAAKARCFEVGAIIDQFEAEIRHEFTDGC